MKKKGIEIFRQLANSQAITSPPDQSLPEPLRIVVQDAYDVFKGLVSKLFATQEPWILNANLARELIFQLPLDDQP